MSERNHENYFGRITTAFVTLGEFELTESDLTVIFHGWANIESFENGEAPQEFLKKSFSITDAEFQAFKNEYRDAFTNLENALLAIINLETPWNIEHFKINTSNRALTIIADKNQFAVRRRVESLSGAEYDATIVNYSSIVQTILGLAWTYAVEKDAWLASLTQLQELKPLK